MDQFSSYDIDNLLILKKMSMLIIIEIPEALLSGKYPEQRSPPK